MGMYDTVLFKNKKGVKTEIQFKNSDCEMEEYRIGDTINLEDGIYFAIEGAFVVYANVIVAAFDKEEHPLRNKWDGKIKYPDLVSGF